MKVQIKAIVNTENLSPSPGLTGQLYRENENKKVAFLKDITVPLQGKDQNYVLWQELEKGKYIVQILLPDGRTVTKDFEVLNFDIEHEVLIIVPFESPHDWTDAHGIAGNFRLEAHLTEGFTKSLSNNEKGFFRSKSNDLSEDFKLVFLKDDENNRDKKFLAPENLSNLIRENLDVETAIQKFGINLKPEEPTQEDDDFAIFKMFHSGVKSKNQENVNNVLFDYKILKRQYLFLITAQAGKLVSLPIPWQKPFHQGEAEIELLVRKNIFLGSSNIAMTINDTLINVVLGYLNIGAIYQANQLINNELATEMLFHKMDNPFAAAIGAYILINQKSYELGRNEWKEWINNLDRRFNWFPDGAILNSAKHFWLRDYLLSGESFSESFDNALGALNRSYDRGLPFFTFGLKLMIDGFRYFANEDVFYAKERLAVLETIGNQTDPSQPFLTINISSNHKSEQRR